MCYLLSENSFNYHSILLHGAANIEIIENYIEMAKSLRTSEIPAWLKTFLEHQEDSRARQDEARETAQQQQLLAHQQQMQAQQQQMQILQELITIQTNNRLANQPSTSTQINSHRNDKTASTPRPTTLQEDTNYSKFISWRETWQDYVMLIKLENMDVDIQRAHLRSCISEDVR